MVVVVSMTAEAGIRCVVVIAIMTSCTVVGNGSVSTIQLVISIVYIERSWHPVGVGGVA